MAETQNNQYKTINHKKVFDDEDDIIDHHHQENVDLKDSYQSIATFANKPVDDILSLADDDDTAVETANLLLSEHHPNFVDFDEFNICLNNILNDGVDSHLELSPSAVISDNLTTAEVDELLKVNIDDKNQSISHMPTFTFNEKNISITNSSRSSSSNSSSSKGSLHNEHHNKNRTDNIEDDNDLLNLINFGDHMDFSLSSELEGTNSVTSYMTTTTTHITASINKAKQNENIHNTKCFLNNSGHNCSIDKNNVQLVDNDADLNLNMMVDPINIHSTFNQTETVSAATSNINLHGDDINQENNDTPQDTALNNVINRNSHSVVNIFQ